MKLTNSLKSAATSVAVATLLLSNADAVSITYTLTKTINSTNGDFTLGEFTSNFGGNTGYAIDVKNAASLTTFMVSFVGSGAPTVTVPLGWYSEFSTEANWGTTTFGQSQVTGSSIGSFDSLFGTVDTAVLSFTYGNMVAAPPLDPEAGGPLPGADPTVVDDTNDWDQSAWLYSGANPPPFLRGGDPASEFVILDGSGTIQSGSLIPEPTTALMALIGGLGLLRRRR